MVKHASQSDAVVNGVTIPAAVGRAVTQETRKETVEERRDGNYRVRKVDTTVPDGFRVLLKTLKIRRLLPLTYKRLCLRRMTV